MYFSSLIPQIAWLILCKPICKKKITFIYRKELSITFFTPLLSCFLKKDDIKKREREREKR
jgi:hypothetical protein